MGHPDELAFGHVRSPTFAQVKSPTSRKRREKWGTRRISGLGASYPPLQKAQGRGTRQSLYGSLPAYGSAGQTSRSCGGLSGDSGTDGTFTILLSRVSENGVRSVYPEFRPGTTSGAVVSFEKREGRYRSAERVEAHLQVNLVSRYFFRPEIADDGQSMKGVRNVEPSLQRRSRAS